VPTYVTEITCADAKNFEVIHYWSFIVVLICVEVYT